MNAHYHAHQASVTSEVDGATAFPAGVGPIADLIWQGAHISALSEVHRKCSRRLPVPRRVVLIQARRQCFLERLQRQARAEEIERNRSASILVSDLQHELNKRLSGAVWEMQANRVSKVGRKPGGLIARIRASKTARLVKAMYEALWSAEIDVRISPSADPQQVMAQPSLPPSPGFGPEPDRRSDAGRPDSGGVR